MQFVVVALLFASGLYLVIRGGGFVVSGVMKIGEGFNLPPVFVGMTLLALATSAPEIFITLIAAAGGEYGMAIGNTVGGMTATLSVTLGIYAITSPTVIDRRGAMPHILALFLSLVVLFIVVSDGRATIWEGGALLILFAIFVAYGIYTTRTNRVQMQEKARNTGGMSGILSQNAQKTPTYATQTTISSAQITANSTPDISMPRALWFLVAGQILLVMGAILIVQNGERLAQIFGMSETMVGFTIMALGTSSPEIVTIMTAARRGRGDMALGNILGSNVISSTILLGGAAIAADIFGSGLRIDVSGSLVVFAVLLFFTVIATIPILVRGRMCRIHGVILATLYVSYLLYLFLWG